MSATAETTPSRRARRIEATAERGRMGWQEADIARWMRVIGDALRWHTDGRQATEVTIAVSVLNRMLDPARPEHVRLA